MNRSSLLLSLDSRFLVFHTSCLGATLTGETTNAPLEEERERERELFLPFQVPLPCFSPSLFLLSSSRVQRGGEEGEIGGLSLSTSFTHSLPQALCCPTLSLSLSRPARTFISLSLSFMRATLISLSRLDLSVRRSSAFSTQFRFWPRAIKT